MRIYLRKRVSIHSLENITRSDTTTSVELLLKSMFIEGIGYFSWKNDRAQSVSVDTPIKTKECIQVPEITHIEFLQAKSQLLNGLGEGKS